MMNVEQAQKSAALGEMWPVDMYVSKQVAYAAYATASRVRQSKIEQREIFGQPNPLIAYYDRQIASYERTVEEIEAEREAIAMYEEMYG